MLPFVFPTRKTVETSVPTTSPTTSSRFPHPAPSPLLLLLLLSLRTFSGIDCGSFFVSSQDPWGGTSFPWWGTRWGEQWRRW